MPSSRLRFARIAPLAAAGGLALAGIVASPAGASTNGTGSQIGVPLDALGSVSLSISPCVRTGTGRTAVSLSISPCVRTATGSPTTGAPS